MSDDIDIEEHDVLENPLIKRIFPDLSVLKKEIIEYNNYDHDEDDEESSPVSKNDELSSTQAVTGASEQGEYSSGLNNNNINNKIVLGSGHSSNHKKHLTCVKKAKICLPNITQFLNNNIKFCKLCLILFPSQDSLNRHTLITHKGTEKNCNFNENIENNKLKESNYKCQKCQITFVSLGNLNRHTRNFHSNSKNVKNKDDDKLITEVNVMVKINESNVKLLAENNLKECFHCDLMFTTQQLLIDHLYEVLNSKKTQITRNETCTEDKTNEKTKDEETNKQNNIGRTNEIKLHRNIDNDNKKDDYIDKIYACPICSYCFNVWDFYEAHMKKKHGVNKVKQTSKVSYKPNCKFCDLQYSTFKSYNTHLHKRHKSKIFTQVKPQISTGVKNKVIRKVTSIQNKQQMKQKVVFGSNKVKFDIILKQQENNREQLNCIKNDVKVMALKTILFKCRQCDIHFLTSESARSHASHSSLENSNCKYCEKYFKVKDMKLHWQQHKYSNYFTVTNISTEENVTIEYKRPEKVKRTLHKCPYCAVHFSKEYISDHYSCCEREASQSTYCKICDILIADNIKISHAEEHDIHKLKPSDFKIVEFKKIKNKPIRRKQDSSPKKVLLNLSYCGVCKCNVARAHYKCKIHFQSRCSHLIKYVCKYCGLVFSNKSITTHRKLHQKFNNLSLKNFTFYDLKNGNKILPPIPVFPKCNSCGKHFITKFEIKRHVCSRNNHLTCPTCQIKLSQTAYKLHIPFHDLILNGDYKESNRSLTSDDMNLDVNLSLSNDVEVKEESIAIFTCKNCDVSFNLYDQAIDHCHSHTHLDTTNPNVIECMKCKLNCDANCYEEHLQLHTDFPVEKFKYIKFDVFNFGSTNDKWLKHMFGSMPQALVDSILKNAIYKYETRVKMRIINNGSSDGTAYKCEKCKSFIDTHSIYDHCQTCNENQKDLCNICHRPATPSADDEHEECNSRSKSLKIVEFNRKEDVDVNYKIANMRKCYVLYECRTCHSVIEKNYKSHLCAIGASKECCICGLLLNQLDYDTHTVKHKQLPSFNGNYMKVILLGAKVNTNNSFQGYSDVLSKFCGIVCDYTFYKCLNCDVCVRDQRNTSQHYCLIDAAKSKCPKCDLTFDEGKLKGHLKLHDTDPDFVKETIYVQTFHNNKLFKKTKSESIEERKSSSLDVKVQEKSVKIYKCVCGLHYLSEATFNVHIKKCNGKIKTKQSKQNCSKCDLTFSPDVLFKHLIEHHGNKNILFQYEIINFHPKPSFSRTGNTVHTDL